MINRPSLLIGVEEEYQIIDPQTRNLEYVITRSSQGEEPVLRGHDSEAPLNETLADLTRSLASPTLGTVAEVRDALLEQRITVCRIAQELGLTVAAAGAHPFASWRQAGVPMPGRFVGLHDELRGVAERLLVFGMHVHIGIEDRDFLIDCMNVARYVLPHILTLTTSSPFWMGRDTGLQSYRCVVQENLPRSGIPQRFASYAEFQHYVDVLTRTNCIRSVTDVWWDIRPHPIYPSLEIRILDMMPRVEDATAVIAVVQAVVAWLHDLRSKNISFRLYQTSLVAENKWRAERYGLNGKMIDFGKEEQLPARFLVRELLRLIDPYIDELGSRREINHVYTIVERGTSADRQRAVYRDHGGDANREEALRAVVDHLVEETMICVE
ncbi:MAG: carboxylate-amine ligase [Anaerolineae bacterium]|nr:carboxylate-amine ligase [Anaerolineae bacterium]